MIFDLSFPRYRTRAEDPPGRDPRRYAWEDGEVCEYRLERGRLVRRTALLVHLQKRTMRPPAADVLGADRYWILANGFAVQQRVSPWAVRAARIPAGREWCRSTGAGCARSHPPPGAAPGRVTGASGSRPATARRPLPAWVVPARRAATAASLPTRRVGPSGLLSPPVLPAPAAATSVSW